VIGRYGSVLHLTFILPYAGYCTTVR
jgi:hypothetical protein